MARAAPSPAAVSHPAGTAANSAEATSRALEEIAGVPGQVRAAVIGREREDMLALASQMTVHDVVSGGLESCPWAG